VDTDQLAPGHAMKDGRLQVIAEHCLESVRPEFHYAVRRGDVIVAGANFGVGSSREQAAAVLAYLGVAAVVAPSFSGLFFRNAFNVGLLLLTCPRALDIADGVALRFDAREGRIILKGGVTLACEAIPEFLLERIEAGGLLPELKRRFASAPPSSSNPPPSA
jgi:3-isopropylmalate/(R)-2-methylmalate dehydratase small subunit